MFYLSQVLGLLALIVLCLSFLKNNKKELLKHQILSSILFAFQYLFLNAFSGCFMNLMTLLRNIIFRKYDKNIPLVYLIIIVILMIILGILSYNGPISILPVIAVILYSYGIWQKKLTVTRVIELISCSLFIIYNIQVLAITGLLSTIIELFFALIAIYKFDIKKKLS